MTDDKCQKCTLSSNVPVANTYSKKGPMFWSLLPLTPRHRVVGAGRGKPSEPKRCKGGKGLLGISVLRRKPPPHYQFTGVERKVFSFYKDNNKTQNKKL